MPDPMDDYELGGLDEASRVFDRRIDEGRDAEPKRKRKPWQHRERKPVRWMHEDLQASDASPMRGPTSEKLTLRAYQRRTRLFGMCSGFAVTSQGFVVTASFDRRNPMLVLLDPEGDAILDATRLPQRLGTVEVILSSLTRSERARLRDREDELTWREARKGIRRGRLFRDTSGGAYFTLTSDDRILVPVPGGEVWVFAIGGSSVSPRLSRTHRIEVALSADQQRSDDRDSIVGVMPIESSQPATEAFVVTRHARVAVIPLGTNGARVTPVPLWHGDSRTSGGVNDSRARERVQNSFSVLGSRAFVVSNFALYAIDAAPAERTRLAWRNPYPRLCDTVRAEREPWTRSPKEACQYGTCEHNERPGSVDRGSGTTPTVVDDAVVAIADGGNPMRLRTFRLDDGTPLDDRTVFPSLGEKAVCENSVIVCRRDGRTRLVIANSYGYRSPFETEVADPRGLAAFDLHHDGTLVRAFELVDQEVGTATPKYSPESELLYLYAARDSRYRLLGIDVFFDRDNPPSANSLCYDVPLFEASRGPDANDEFDNIWATFTVTSTGTLFGGWRRGYFVVTDVLDGFDRTP